MRQVAHENTEVLIAYKQRIKCDEAFFAAASRHFFITTAWSQADVRNEADEDGGLRGGPYTTGAETTQMKGGDWEDNVRVGSAGRAQPSVIGDWVSGASCCILRFLRRPPTASCEESEVDP